MSDQQQKVLYIGFGSTALACARESASLGWEVHGVARSDRLRTEAETAGITLHQGDLGTPENWDFPLDFDTLVVAAATKAYEAGRDSWALYVDAHQRLVDWLLGRPATELPNRILVVSTTSVYGPGSVLPDGTIDETSPLDPRPKPGRGGAKTPEGTNYTAAMEEVWRATDLPWVMLRVPGIRKSEYGSEDDPIARKMRAGTYEPPKEDRCYQTIRLEALARVTAQLVERAKPQSVYNLTPPTVTSIVRRAKETANILGLSYDWPSISLIEDHPLIISRSLKTQDLMLAHDEVPQPLPSDFDLPNSVLPRPDILKSSFQRLILALFLIAGCFAGLCICYFGFHEIRQDLYPYGIVPLSFYSASLFGWIGISVGGMWCGFLCYCSFASTFELLRKWWAIRQLNSKNYHSYRTAVAKWRISEVIKWDGERNAVHHFKLELQSHQKKPRLIISVLYFGLTIIVLSVFAFACHYFFDSNRFKIYSMVIFFISVPFGSFLFLMPIDSLLNQQDQDFENRILRECINERFGHIP